LSFKESALLEPLARVRRLFIVRSPVGRELLILVSALLIGVIGVPLAIWFVGNRILGPYTHGTNLHAGPMALLGDFFAGLSLGWISFWCVAVGPLLIITLARLAWMLIVPKRPVAAVPPSKKRRIEPTVAED
jgi:hypothetical protein